MRIFPHDGINIYNERNFRQLPSPLHLFHYVKTKVWSPSKGHSSKAPSLKVRTKHKTSNTLILEAHPLHL